MEAVGALLRGLPLQPEDSDRADLMEAKSELFSKYFMLFMKLINDCNKPPSSGKKDDACKQSPTVATNKLTTLRNTTIQAMSNLLSANIDSGLRHSIRMQIYQIDRRIFLEELPEFEKRSISSLIVLLLPENFSYNSIPSLIVNFIVIKFFTLFSLSFFFFIFFFRSRLQCRSPNASCVHGSAD